MGCVRRRGKLGKLKLKTSEWRSFKETFKTKLEVTEWFVNFGKELMSKPHWVKIH